MQDGQFFTWQALSAMGGASLLTFYIVQYTKRLVDRFISMPTDIYALLVAFVVLLVAQLALGADPADWRIYPLTFANAFLVAGVAAQQLHKAINPPGKDNNQNG
jgi:hypothetical protein